MNSDTSASNSASRPMLKEQAASLLEQLFQTYPAVFRPFGERELRPLKLGIHKDLAPIVREWGYSVAVLKYAMGMYTRQARYQFALLKNDYRVDLHGEPAGEITEAHRQTAQEKVDLIMAKRKKTQEAHKAANRQRPKKPKPAASPKGVSERKLAALQEKLSKKASF